MATFPNVSETFPNADSETSRGEKSFRTTFPCPPTGGWKVRKGRCCCLALAFAQRPFRTGDLPTAAPRQSRAAVGQDLPACGTVEL